MGVETARVGHHPELRPGERFVYAQHFSDASGALCKPSFAPTYPDRLLTKVVFTPEGATETRVTVRWEILGEATTEERDTFDFERFPVLANRGLVIKATTLLRL